MEYVCPVCKKRMARDLVEFISHTEEHIADEIKKKHPDWEEEDGVCRKCISFYRSQMKGRT